MSATVESCFVQAHLRIDRLAAELSSAIAASDLRAARFHYKELARHVRSHLYFEETFMLPLLEMACGAHGPVCVLRREHGEIDDRLGALEAALFLGNLVEIKAELDAALLTLENHHGREERVLYPMLDQQLDEPARRELVDAIQLHL